MKITKFCRSSIYNKEYRNIYMPFMWHGFFIDLTMAMIEINTVLPALVSNLTNNTIAFGALYSIMLGAPLIFNLLFSNYLRRFVKKKIFLIIGIYMRGISFFGVAAATLVFGNSNKFIVLISLYFLLFLFSISGGFAGIAYSDIVGKLLPSERRGKFYATREFVGGIASLIGGFLVAWIFRPNTLGFPVNYALSFFIGGMGLTIGTLGFWRLNEPYSEIDNKIADDKNNLVKNIFNILKGDKRFLRFIITENVTSFSLMILPFYMMFIKNSFMNYMNYIGLFVISKEIGSIMSNLIWAYVSRKFGSKTVIRLCILVGGSLPILALLIKTLGPLAYIIIFLFIGVITSGRYVGFESYILDIAPTEKRMLYLGIRGTLNILVVLLPLAGGLFINLLGYNLTFGLVSIFMMLAFYLIK
ncbi:MFS transporter [Candidatus Clostridium radicumherbarum]|uniref:MFS transporter n=1 Tax=Candidatus Clostridium radicumherbarum TaxID=3381662 RepID=A0ABW8TU56_9CLOT